ncbi:MAG: hypothetical protein R6X34_07145 [Chloroflexota bacterium]
MQTVTISLPDHVYRQVKQRSQQNQREIADELVSVVIEALPEADARTDWEADLAQLALLSDDELWAAARTQATEAENEQMQQLLARQKRLGLTTAEQEELTLLANFFRRIMLVRAEAAVLLKDRGHDIRSLGPSTQV